MQWGKYENFLWHRDLLSIDLFDIFAQVRQSCCNSTSIKSDGRRNETQRVDTEYLRKGTVSEGVNSIRYGSNFYLKFHELIQTKSLCNYQQSSKKNFHESTSLWQTKEGRFFLMLLFTNPLGNPTYKLQWSRIMLWFFWKLDMVIPFEQNVTNLPVAVLS